MIRVLGGGLAGLTAAHLLSQKGIEARICSAGGPPADQPLLLGVDTVELIAKLFGKTAELWKLGQPIEARLVAKPSQDLTSVPAPSLAIGMKALLSVLPKDMVPEIDAHSDVEFEIDATGRNAIAAKTWPGQTIHGFGKRKMVIAQVEGRLTDAIMEMTRTGWVFAFPSAKDRIIVQSMMCSNPPDPDVAMRDQISGTKHIRQKIVLPTHFQVASVPAAPQSLRFMAAEPGLAIGAAAFAMDPICGDGTGSAVRSAILASAVSEEARNNKQASFAHYQARLVRSFQAHLSQVAEFYKPLTHTGAWVGELRSTYRHVQNTKLQGQGPDANFGYRLKDTRLERDSGRPTFEYEDQQNA